MAEDDDLLDVAGAIADGTPLDWRALEATAATPEARDRLHRLELLAGIGRLHADLTYPRPDESRLHESILHPRKGSRGGLDDSPAPVSWGPLTIIEKVGRGTFGEVYRAREARLDRDVALKLLRHKDAASTASSDVIEEARLMAKVHHPNVTTIFGAERIDGRVGLWMEFIDGRTLEDELAARDPFGADDLRRVGTDIASALSAVHRAGLLHRDVKAHNVMRAADGRLLLTDFGTGRPLASQAGELVDELAGSPLYLAPEVLNGSPATVQSDIYSLGVLLYRLATRSFPVGGKTLQELRAAHAAGARARLHDARRDLPKEMVDAIDDALASVPTNRPPTAEAFAAMLIPTPIAPRRTWRVTGLVAVAAAIVVAVAGWYALRGTRQAPAGGDAFEQSVLKGPDAEGVIAVSPDGRLTAYIDGDTGNLGVRDLATGARRLLTKSGAHDGDRYAWAEGARFSRDGRRLAYGWVEDTKDETRYELRVINVDQSRESSPLYVRADVEWLAPFDWSPDGRFIAISVEHDATADVAIVDVGGGPPTVLASVDWRGVHSMAFSPDGRYLAYDAVPNELTAERDAFVVSTDTRQVHAIVTGPGRDSIVGWSANPNGVLIASNRRGSMSLWRQDMVDGAPQGEPVLVRADIHEGTFGITNDDRVFYQMTTRNEPIMVASVDLNTGAVRAPLVTPIISGLSDHRKPTWSPDGRSFAYISATSTDEPTLPTQRILSIQSDGVLRTLSVKLARWYWSTWARDGRSLLVFALDFQRHVGISRLDVSTGNITPVIVDRNDIYPWMPQWANDGRHFYYMRGPNAWSSDIATEFVERNSVSGKDRVVFRDRDLKRPDGTPAPPLRDWTVSPDGKLVAGLETNGYHAIWVKPLNSLTAREIYRVPASDCQVPITHFALVWTPDSRGVVVNAGVRCNPTIRELWVVPVAAGQAPSKLDIRGVRLRNEAPAVSPDGHQVAFQTGDDPVYEIRALRYGASRR